MKPYFTVVLPMVRVDFRYIDSEELEQKDPAALLDGVDGILVPGGFGNRGIEGKISTIEYARLREVPFFGICLGMQLAVLEYALMVWMVSWCPADGNPSHFARRRGT